MKNIDYKTLKVGDAVITRDGRKGRVICVDAETKGINGWQPIVCLIPDENEGEEAIHYCKDGSFIEGETAGHDIFLPPKTEKIDLYRINKKGKDSLNSKFLVLASPSTTGSHYDFIKTIEVEV